MRQKRTSPDAFVIAAWSSAFGKDSTCDRRGFGSEESGVRLRKGLATAFCNPRFEPRGYDAAKRRRKIGHAGAGDEVGSMGVVTLGGGHGFRRTAGIIACLLLNCSGYCPALGPPNQSRLDQRR